MAPVIASSSSTSFYVRGQTNGDNEFMENQTIVTYSYSGFIYIYIYIYIHTIYIYIYIHTHQLLTWGRHVVWYLPYFPPTSRLYFRPGVSWELRINWRRRHLLIPSSVSCTMLYKVVPPFDSVQLVNITPMSLWFIYR